MKQAHCPDQFESLTRSGVLTWLRENDESRLQSLWEQADAVRREYVGDAVHLRGLIEISNCCRRQCGYCGLRADNRGITRYRMTHQEIMSCVEQAVVFGYGTVVMQAGEDEGLEAQWLVELIRRIKGETKLAVTLSLGERADAELVAWREAGADRYLLRFETSDERLYRLIHPSLPGRRSDRFAILRTLRSLGYEVGSGVMLGIPGQSYESLVDDLRAFHELDLDMIGVGPYIAHPDTPLARRSRQLALPDGEQVPNTELLTYKAMALTRLLRPDANIPSTTALATLNTTSGRELGLARGANVVMPNLTPPAYRQLYKIYPAKACVSETAEACRLCLGHRIEAMNRHIGVGPGARSSSRPPGHAGKVGPRWISDHGPSQIECTAQD